jgi:hypothetical protein
MKILKTRRSFRKEFKRQLQLAIVAAIGFTIAYAWKETILNMMENTAINIGNAASLGYSPLFMPILTTFLGVILIFLLSKILKS